MKGTIALRAIQAAILACFTSGLALAQHDAASGATFMVTPVAERVVHSLPAQPLYWVVETFHSHAEAARGATAHALLVDESNVTWRFTLAGGGLPKSGGELVARIGPVPIPQAASYLLRINRAGGPPGVKTPVHTHPGSEAFFVRSGSLCQRTQNGTARLEQGQSMNGHSPGMVMQLTSCGSITLDQFVMFVVDAHQPFSTPAQFR